MEDLAAAIQSILNDPKSMAEVQSIMNSLSGAGSAAPSSAATVPVQAPAMPVGNPLLAQNLSGDPMTALLLRAAPLLMRANEEDDSTRLLTALRPLLSEARQKKLDEAAKILKLLHLLPVLKESGILANIL